MRRKLIKPDKEAYNLMIKDVSAESRYLFNKICKINYQETPAEIFARMVRTELNNTFGEGHAAYTIQRYRDYQTQLKEQLQDEHVTKEL